MPTFRGLPALFLMGFAIDAISAQPPVRIGNTFWLPVTEAERAMAAPVVDKDAGVEALQWRVHIYDEIQGQDVQRVLLHYVRLKVFTEKGIARATNIEIPSTEQISIVSVSGRTVKPDGSIVELKKEEIRERDIVRTRRSKYKAVSFAMPAVEPGAIVEYRWREIRFNPPTFHIRLQFQQDVPVQKITYFLQPIARDVVSYRMVLRPFNCTPTRLKLENDGFNSTMLENVPAFQEEPMMVGAANVRPWALVFYSEGGKRDPDKYWNNSGKEIYSVLRDSLRIDDAIKAAAQKAVEGAATDKDKVVALIRYIRKNLRGFFDADVTESERAAVLRQMPKRRYRPSTDVLKSGIGMNDELNALFAAMASSVGLDARPALVADRTDIAFHPSFADSYFLNNVDMAVKIGEEWKIFDVSRRRLPPHLLSWNEEGMAALVSDPKKPFFVEVPLSAPDESVTFRKGDMTLTPEGALEGKIRKVFTGHVAAEERVALMNESEEKRKEYLTEDFRKQFPQAEVTGVAIANVEDTERPLEYNFEVKIPDYATRTGKRMFFQPLFLLKGAPPLFAASERRYALDFRYGWKEVDSMTIRMPEGFELDHPDNPGSLKFGQPGGYELNMSISGDGSVFQCNRDLIFGLNGAIMYEAKLYPMVKKAFDEVQRRDQTVISLKQKEGQ